MTKDSVPPAELAALRGRSWAFLAGVAAPGHGAADPPRRGRVTKKPNFYFYVNGFTQSPGHRGVRPTGLLVIL